MKSYRVTHLDRGGSEIEDVVWASSLDAARKKAEARFDDVLDVARGDGSGAGALVVVVLLAIAFLVILGMFA